MLMLMLMWVDISPPSSVLRAPYLSIFNIYIDADADVDAFADIDAHADADVDVSAALPPPSSILRAPN